MKIFHIFKLNFIYFVKIVELSDQTYLLLEQFFLIIR